MRTPPLHGIRVLDLTRLLPGPLCAQHLADMGADVIKVEDTRGGDYARDTRDYYALVNRNKRSIKLDLKNDAGRAAFLKLARTADAVVEGFRPGVVDRLGVGYVAVRAVNAKIVYCGLSGYGQDGPYSQRAGHDLNYLSYAGVTDQIGIAGGAPAIPNLQIADLLGGTLSAAMGILAALLDAARSGEGRYVDVSMADCSLAHNIMPLMALNQNGTADARGTGLLSGGVPWYAIYRTADDGYVSLGALENKFWTAFCEEIGKPEWAAQQSSGPEAEARIAEELTAIFRSRSRDYWTARFEHVDCCFSPVLSPDEAVEHEQFQARGMFTRRAGRRHYAFPVKFSEFEFAIERPAPGYGEHTREVLKELGYGDRELADLESQGVI